MGPFFHGGTRRLHRGGVLLPASRTGAPSLADHGAEGVTRRDRVYFTDQLEMARMFALLAPPKGHGSVYEVEPLGDLEHDPDYIAAEGGSWQAPMARVVRVVERRVTTCQRLDISEAAVILNGDGEPWPVSARFQRTRVGEAA